MKRFCFALIFLILFGGGFASAENSEITFFAGGFLGDSFVYRPPQLFRDVNATLEDNVLGGFRIAYFLTNRLSVEGGVAFNPSSVLAKGTVSGGSNVSAVVDVDTYVFNANAVAHLVNGPVIPFLTAGVAAVHFDFHTPSLPGAFLIPSETDAALNAGGGVKIPFRNNTAFRVDGRYYWINPQFSPDERPRFVEVSGGVAILFNF